MSRRIEEIREFKRLGDSIYGRGRLAYMNVSSKEWTRFKELELKYLGLDLLKIVIEEYDEMLRMFTECQECKK